ACSLPLRLDGVDVFSPNQTSLTSTIKEEIALAKGWLAVSENSKDGNAKKQAGFWCEVLEYIERQTKQFGRRMYDMESGARDEDYVQRAMIHYEIETGIPFKLRHCWEILKDRPKWQEIALPKFSTGSGGSKRHKSSSSSSFNIESGKASINLNTNVGDNDEDEVQEIQRPEGRDKAREERLAFLEIKSKEVECYEREIEQQDMRFYLQPYDHLTGDQQNAMEEIKAKIKAKYNLQY
ncbi:putative reverse transcriptase domain-containing protein, partial [Tanacetum coccineum]